MLVCILFKHIKEYSDMKALLKPLSLVVVSMISFPSFAQECKQPNITVQYDDVGCLIGDYALVKKNRKFYLLNKMGETVKALNYDLVMPSFPDHYNVANQQSNGELLWGVLNSKGELVIPVQYQEIKTVKKMYSQNKSEYTVLQVTQRDTNGRKLIGFIDEKNNILTPIKYNKMSFVYGDSDIYALVNREDKEFNFIDYTGKEVLSVPYTYVSKDIVNNKLSVGRKIDGVLKTGLYDLTTAREIIPLQIEGELHNFYGNIAVVSRVNKKLWQMEYAFINIQGQYLTGFEFDQVSNFNQAGFAQVKKNGLFGLIDTSGKTILPIEYKSIGVFSEGLMAVENKRGKVGFVDNKGKIVIPMEYSAAAPFKNGLAAVYKNGKGIYINKNNQPITKYKYDATGPYRDGLAQVARNKKIGLINSEGVEVLVPQFDGIEYFYNNVAVVVLNKKYGLINNKGEIILPADYDFLDKNLGQYKASIVGKNKKYGLIDSSGNLISTLDYDDISIVKGAKGQIFSFKKGSQQGFLDMHARMFDYDTLNPVKNTDALFYFTKGNRSGYVDINGNEYERIDELGFWAGYRVKKGNKYGVINEDTGKFILPLEYDYIGLPNQKGQYVAISKNKSYGFLRADDLKIVIPFKYEQAESFNNNLAFVKMNGKWGMIDNFEKVIIPFEYESLNFRQDNFLNAKRGGFVGLIDKQNKVIIPFQYDEIGSFSEGFAYVIKNKKYGFVNQQGRLVIPLQYDSPSNLGFFQAISYIGRNYYRFSGGEAFVVRGKEAFDIDKSGNRIIRSIPTHNSDYLNNSSSGTTSQSKQEKHTILKSIIESGYTRSSDYYYLQVRCRSGEVVELSKFVQGSNNTWHKGRGTSFFNSTGHENIDNAIKYVCE